MIFAPENDDVVIGAAAASASFVASIIDDDAIACGQSGSDEQSVGPNQSVQGENLEAAVKLESAGDSMIHQMFARAKHYPDLEARMDAYKCLQMLSAQKPGSPGYSQEAQTAVAALEDQGMWENCPVDLYVYSFEGTWNQRACSGKYSLVAKWIASPAGYPLWRHSRKRLWLYKGTEGSLYVGDDEELDRDFGCDQGYIRISKPSAGKLPHELPDLWERYDEDSDEWISTGVVVSNQPVSLNALALSIRAAGQDENVETLAELDRWLETQRAEAHSRDRVNGHDGQDGTVVPRTKGQKASAGRAGRAGRAGNLAH